MYFIVLAAMMNTASPTPPLPLPSVVASYKTLKDCRAELITIGKYKGFELVRHPLLGNAVVRQYGDEGLTLIFCARDMRSV